MNDTIEPNAKVMFRVTYEDGSSETEHLWADPVGDDRYRLDNCPFYAYCVSWHDIVLAPVHPDEGVATFQEVVEKSGNRTIRIRFEVPVQDGNASQAVLDHLVSLGCSYEGANRKLIAINIPPDVPLFDVGAYLVEQQLNWEYADPTYEQLYENA